MEIQSNLAIRNFLVALKLFLNAKSSLFLWSKWQIGHMKWFLNTNLFLIKPFLIAKFDCTSILDWWKDSYKMNGLHKLHWKFHSGNFWQVMKIWSIERKDPHNVEKTTQKKVLCPKDLWFSLILKISNTLRKD